MLTCPAAWATPTPVPVQTDSGWIEGTDNGSVRTFFGIPYAQPPVGPLRWRAPQPAHPWQGIRQANAFGPACLQKVAAQEPERSLKDFPQSEDCLSLNIWVPSATHTGPLPVMVWIHGGSFRFGAGSLGLYSGADLARQGIIVVTLNYRLGLFGTFAHPALHRPDEPGGNYGLMDVIAALQWVQHNISAFGGNPGAVTLAGESAGGVSVSYLMASPLARHLFQQAIMESGGLSLPEYSKDRAEDIAQDIARRLHAQDAGSLRALPADAIRNVATSPAETMPFIDGKIITAPAHTSFTEGHIPQIPLLIGNNTAEAGFFGPRYWQNLPADLGTSRWQKLSVRCFDYGSQGDDACKEQVASEWFAGANGRILARGAAARHAQVYVYRFGWVPLAERKKKRGAIHTAEIPYVFGHVAHNAKQDPASRALSRELSARWVAFVRSASPQLKAGDWPNFSREHESVLLINPDGITVGPNPANAMLDTIDALELPPRP